MTGSDTKSFFRFPVGNSTSTNQNLWGSTTNSVLPFTLEFIQDLKLRVDSNGNPVSVTSVGGLAAGSQDQSGLYEFGGYGNNNQVSKNILRINGTQFSEYGFGGSTDSNSGSPSVRNTNDYSPNVNFNYSGTHTGWEQIIVTRDSSGNLKMYRNKSVFYSVSSSINYYNNFGTFFGFIFGCFERFCLFEGSWGIVRGYDKVFSQTDVDSQYNAQKARFGLP